MLDDPPFPLLRAGEPSRTALWVARLRAVHQLLDEPLLLDDPFALPILGPADAAELRADPFRLNDPLSRTPRATVVLRSAFAEEEVARAVAAGVAQYVVLGAGLERQTLASGLAAAGFRADRPACVSWLGVAVYLTEESVMETLRFVAALPRGSSIVFDFRPPAALLDPIAQATAEAMKRNAAALGEPWRSAFDPAALRQKMCALGFSDARTFEPDELNQRYLARRKDGLHAFVRMAHGRV